MRAFHVETRATRAHQTATNQKSNQRKLSHNKQLDTHCSAQIRRTLSVSDPTLNARKCETIFEIEIATHKS